jgi:pimeloyl-ACP methyl ester carboxylesterase
VVITYDNRGTGLSVVPQQPEDYTIGIMANDLHDVVQELGLARFHLLGYSMGGCIALQYAYDHQDRVKTLCLLSSTAGGSLYVKPAPELSAALANPQGKTLWDIYMWTFALMYSAEAMERCEPVFKQIYENSRELPTTPTGLRGHSHAFRNFDGSSFLQHLEMPTAIIAGTADRLMPVGNAENLTAIPNGHLVLLPDVEHGAHIEQEQNVLEAIDRLIGSQTQD